MATKNELSDFLENVERRAFKQARYLVRKDEVALDVVQDAMIKLAEKYGDRPAAEFPMLFQRILQNTVNDYFRREKTRSNWISPFSAMFHNNDGNEIDSHEFIHENGGETESSATKLERAQTLQIIDLEVKKLPLRQREAFLMRYLHDMDVSETAEAMGCTEGSVKTHCFRATHALAKALKARGITL